MMVRKMDFSYKDGNDFVFSDPETYETTTPYPEVGGYMKNYLVENGSVTITFVEDKAVSLELPSSVVLMVKDAPEGIRGNSRPTTCRSRSFWKRTSLVQVPSFINWTTSWPT